ncbi:O-methyltransferase-domain-containing protein [Xylaria sp. FL0043]|nr:O-methyltransferase-domain-containing protein [Xylaria sp. FL0043]
MGSHIFTEDLETRRVRYTASSRLLAIDQGFFDAERHEQDTAELNQSAFCIFNKTKKSFFAFLAIQPERARRFGSAMGYFTKGKTWDLRHMLTAFDWPLIDRPRAQVVDIGGRNGQISKYLARHTKHMHYIVQDLGYVVSQAPLQLPEDLTDRVSFVKHDFFTPQTIEPPTAFILRFILHNWADKYATLILQNLVPAMRKGTKLLINEYVLEDGPVTDLTGRFGFQVDAIMMTSCNAQERTAAEYERVLKGADSRYVVEAVCRPEGSTMSIVQVGWTM